MAPDSSPLKEVNRVEITTVLDNFIDVLLPGSETVKRVSLGPDWLTKEILIAEHGFAAMVKVSAGNTSDSPAGSRSMHTLRKLAITAPNAAEMMMPAITIAAAPLGGTASPFSPGYHY